MIGTLISLQCLIYDSVKVAFRLPRPPPPEMPESLKAKLNVQVHSRLITDNSDCICELFFGGLESAKFLSSSFVLTNHHCKQQYVEVLSIKNFGDYIVDWHNIRSRKFTKSRKNSLSINSCGAK